MPVLQEIIHLGKIDNIQRQQTNAGQLMHPPVVVLMITQLNNCRKQSARTRPKCELDSQNAFAAGMC